MFHKITFTLILFATLITPQATAQPHKVPDSLLYRPIDLSLLEPYPVQPRTEGCDSVFFSDLNKYLYYNSDTLFHRIATQPLKEIYEDVWFYYLLLDVEKERIPAEREKLQAAAKRYNSKALYRELDVFDTWCCYRSQSPMTLERWNYVLSLVEKYERKNDLQTKLRILCHILFSSTGFPSLDLSARIENERIPIIKIINECFSTLERLDGQFFFNSGYPYFHLGRVYYEYKLYNKAIPLLWKALEQPVHYFFDRSQMKALDYLGDYYCTIGDYNRSDSLYLSILQSSDTVFSRPVDETIAIGALAANAMFRGEKEEAIRLYAVALPRALQVKDFTLAGAYAVHLGQLYLEKNQPDKTKNLLRDAEKYLLKGNLPIRGRKDFYTLARDYYLKINHTVKIAAYIDSIALIQNMENAVFNTGVLAYAEQEAFEMEKMLKEEQLANAKKRMLLLLVFLVFTLAIICILIYFYRKKQETNRSLFLQIKEQDKLTEQLENERRRNHNLRIQVGLNNIQLSEKEIEDEKFEKLTVLMKKELLFTDSEIKRTDVAAKIGLSDRGLHDCLKNNLNMSFMEYINHLRLSHAAHKLLLSSNEKITIEGIAIDAGFNSYATFYRLFRQKYGLSPDEFKKIAKKSH